MVTTSAFAGGLSAITIGPMFHVNFGGKEELRFSWGFEASYWISTPSNHKENEDDDFSFNLNEGVLPMHSIDLGFEAQRKKVLFYCEYQVGLIWAGASVGPVLEYNGNAAQVGFQGSVWGDYFLGLDFRLRKIIHQPLVYAPGVMFKIPVMIGPK